MNRYTEIDNDMNLIRLWNIKGINRICYTINDNDNGSNSKNNYKDNNY